MAAGLPAGGKVEVEFTAGAWTDITADVEPDAFTIKRGRTSEFSAPSVGTLDGLKLNNVTGKYSPLSQVLTDGSPHPYWPNVVPRKRVRYSNTPAGVRFVGYIKGWPPFVDSSRTPWVMITATDRLDQLSRFTMSPAIQQVIMNAGPMLYWPLSDPANSSMAGEQPTVLAGEQSTTHDLPMLPAWPAQAAMTFGDVGPGADGATGVKFNPTSQSSGQFLGVRGLWTINAFTVMISVNPGATRPAWSGAGPGEIIYGMENLNANFNGILSMASGIPSYHDSTTSINGPWIADGAWHHIAITRGAIAGPVTMYVDGVSVGATAASTAAGAVNLFTVGDSASQAVYGDARYQGNAGQFAIFNRALTGAEIAAAAAATIGYLGETAGVRIARWLTLAGLTSADWNLDPGQSVLGAYAQVDKNLVTACQDMASSEGGGSVFYVGADGRMRFTDRAFRKPAAPVMTLDAEADLDGSVYAPSFDSLTLVNSSTATRDGGTPQTYVDDISVSTYDLSSDTLTSYASTDADAYGLAQSHVAANAYPGFRLPQVGVDLLTATTVGLYAELAAVEIGSRIRVVNLPKAMGPATQIDVIVEGWAETVAPDQYTVVFDTSPADNPARGVYDDTAYGRYQCSGQTLNVSITNAGTTVVIATGAGLPTFTTVSARYPLQIQVGAEVMTLTAAPGGAASPQTFTGVTRGVAGTSASAQASGAVVKLSPAATYTL